MRNFHPSFRQFQPSKLSARTPVIAQVNYSAATRTVVDVSTLGTSAIIRGLSNAALNKDQKYVKATKMVEKYKLGYRKCKAKREGKGKKAYPEDPSKGVFTANCHKDYNKWMKWEGKRADAAKALKIKLEKKGKLDPETAKDLDVAASAQEIAATSEFERDKKRGRKGKKEDYMEVEDVPEVDYTLPIVLGVGALVLLGAGAWFFMRRPAPTPA